MVDNYAFQEKRRVEQRCKDALDQIYKTRWPGVIINRAVSLERDRDQGIDLALTLTSGAVLTIQEKVREFKYLAYDDFTQEYMNGVGTPYESAGEWFKLAADLYSYSWESDTPGVLAKWSLVNVARYKLWVDRQGGLHKVGRLKTNHEFGKASFYAIPMNRMLRAPGVVLLYCNPNCNAVDR